MSHEKETKQTPAAETKAPETEAKAPEQETPKAEKPEDKHEGKHHHETAALQAKLDEAEKKNEELKNQLLRTAAEYDNYRKRSQKEKDNLYTEIRSETVEKFLPVYDNLERALAQETQDAAFKKGVEMTMTQLLDVLASLDIKPIEAVGQPFDPNLHNAVMHIEDEKYGENTVAACFQTGFMMGEKVIRFAMVQVAN